MRDLYELKRQENARLPVARLPPEVLSDVFVCLRDAHVAEIDEEVDASLATHYWLGVSHVSHFWRETAIGAPRLWACVNLWSAASACEFICRAQGVPLEISRPFSSGVSPSPVVLDAARNHPGGISTLKLHGGALELESYLSVLGGRSSDTLHTLQITFTGSPGYHTLPNEIANGTFPKLAVLRLVSCNFDWKYALLRSCAPSLRHILLRDCITPAETLEVQRDQIRAVIDALRSMQRLKSLNLLDSLNGTACEYTEDDGQLALPELQHISINDNAFTCSALLRHLEIPKICHAQLSVYARASPTSTHYLSTFFVSSPASTMELIIGYAYIGIRTPARVLQLWGDEWNIERDAFINIGTVLCAHALHISLCIGFDVTTSVVLRALLATTDTIATELRLEGATLETECMADAVCFLPRLESVSFNDFDMLSVEEDMVERWVAALLERTKRGALRGVDFRGCRGVPAQLVERLEEFLDWVIPPL